ncbi:MAG: peptidase M3, partial [Microvirga sp.]
MTSPAPNFASNPLLVTWTTPQGAPPFATIAPAHFREAFDQAFAAHNGEIDAISGNPEPPTFDNTITAVERAGGVLDRVASVFYALAGAHTNDELLAIERELSPRMAAHSNRIRLNDALFARIEALWRARDDLTLTAEQARV